MDVDVQTKVTETGIDGLHQFPLQGSGKAITITTEDDHRLRRFGELEVLTMDAGDERAPTVRSEADELWVVLDGHVKFTCVDRRDSSPSTGRSVSIELGEVHGKGLFVPFGVGLEIKARETARLVRLASHRQGSHAGDRELQRGMLKPNDPQAGR